MGLIKGDTRSLDLGSCNFSSKGAPAAAAAPGAQVTQTLQNPGSGG